MTLMRVRRSAQLTLPPDVRRALNIQEGDFLNAEIVEDGVLLKAVGVIERQRSWARIEAAVGEVHDLEPIDGESLQAAEEDIASSIRAFRQKNA